MTHHNPISLSVEDLNNVELSAADVHKITLSVIDWFYVQILNAIIAQAAVKLGATALCSVLSKINAESAVVLGTSGSLKAPARIIGSAGMALGATAEAEVSVTARIIALASVVLGSEAVMSTVSKIIGAAGVGLGGTANVVAPSKINGAAGVVAGASGVAVVRSLLVAQSGAQFGAQVAARCPAIIIGSAGMGMGATAQVDAGGATLWTPALLSNLALWLDASDISTITKDEDDYVSQWDDKSGNDRHVTQGTGSLQPVYNSNKLTFDGSNDVLTHTSNPIDSSEMCLIAVFSSPNVNNTSRGVLSIRGTTADEQAGGTLIGYDSGRLKVTNFSVIDIFTGLLSNGNTYIAINNNTSSQKEGRLNGTSLFDSAFSLIATSDSTIYVGSEGPHKSNIYHYGDIYELIATDCNLVEEDMQKIEGYLAHKWGLTAKLPVDHPYKSTAPIV